jgi:hypothetical protein
VVPANRCCMLVQNFRAVVLSEVNAKALQSILYLAHPNYVNEATRYQNVLNEENCGCAGLWAHYGRTCQTSIPRTSKSPQHTLPSETQPRMSSSSTLTGNVNNTYLV